MKQHISSHTINQLESEKQRLIEKIQSIYQMIEQVQHHGVAPHTFDSPQQYAHLNNLFSLDFIEKVAHIDYTNQIQPIQGFKYHIVAGPISAGKSSLISKACNIQLPIGVGQTTTDVNIVSLTDHQTYIIDTPGINQKFAYFDIRTLSLFKSADFIFYCFCDSLKNSIELLKIIQKLRPAKFCLIRTQVDRADENDSKSICEQLQTDREILKNNEIEAELYAVSVKKSQGFRDNWQVFSKLKGQVE